MERHKSSPWTVGLAVAGLLAVLLVGYVAAYWWRIPAYDVTDLDRDGVHEFTFPTQIETTFFEPAVWVHLRVHESSFFARAFTGDEWANRDNWIPLSNRGR